MNKRRNKHSNLVHGIGVNDGKYHTSVNGKLIKEYSLWTDMLLRCTEKFWKKRSSYVGTTCSDNFKNYSYFYEWCNKQVGFGIKDSIGRYWHLDKDLLFKGNKLYSEDTCVFIPQRVNSLLSKRLASRGKLPIGVSWSRVVLKYRSACNVGEYPKKVTKCLGYFDTPEQAFTAYKIFKEEFIKGVAEKYKWQIDNKVYTALLNYKVSITD